MKRTLAIVVTHNRRRLLAENLDALLREDYPEFDILIVDNNSSDETKELVSMYVEERLIYKNTGSNLGGAGGFAYGMRYAAEKGYEFCWLMDDDTIPSRAAFSNLCRAANRLKGKFSFIGSIVKWTDGSPAVMNIASISKKWYTKTDELRNGLVPVESCSFVSILIKTAYTKSLGLPISEFFIYGDDIEYTSRLSKREKGYVCLDSCVVHKTKDNNGMNPALIAEEKIGLCYYDSRNRFYIAKKTGAYGVCAYLYYQLCIFLNILKSSKTAKLKRIMAVLRGTFAGIVFSPLIEYAEKMSLEEEID